MAWKKRKTNKVCPEFWPVMYAAFHPADYLVFSHNKHTCCVQSNITSNTWYSDFHTSYIGVCQHQWKRLNTDTCSGLFFLKWLHLFPSYNFPCWISKLCTFKVKYVWLSRIKLLTIATRYNMTNYIHLCICFHILQELSQQCGGES